MSQAIPTPRGNGTVRPVHSRFWQGAAQHQGRRAAGLIPIPLVAWFLFLPVDALLGHILYEGATLPAVVIRASSGLVLIGIAILGRKYGAGSIAIREGSIAAFMSTMALGLGALTAYSGALGTIHMMGCVIVMTVPAFVDLPWNKTVLIVVGTLLSFSTSFFAALYALHRLDAFSNSDSTKVAFGFGLLLITTMGAISVAGGHLNHRLRQQVYESRSIGRYQLKKLIGKGGMGEVWAAFHRGLRRDVALKVLRQVDDQSTVRFEREVEALAELRHPNTVRVFDYGVTDDGLLYYAMELLEGMTLGTLVKEQGPVQPQRVIRLMMQVARALGEAHEKGMVHRDLKPDNLVLAAAGGEVDFVKVIDFGIVRLRGQASEGLTLEGYVVGTPNFMAPELVAGAEADARSDVYSMGAVAYFLLTGQTLFHAKGVTAQLTAHVTERVTPPSERISAPLPPGLEAVVMACLSKQPDERPPNGTALANRLLMLDAHRRLSASELPRQTTEVIALEAEQVTQPLPQSHRK
jgi:hypothetical protein